MPTTWSILPGQRAGGCSRSAPVPVLLLLLLFVPVTRVWFDGKDWTLADLFIAADANVNGVGLFGALTGGIQNLHLLNVRVSGGNFNVGGLVGYGNGGRFENLSVTGGSVTSPSSAQHVGGLIGFGDADTVIRYASVSGVDVSGGDQVGGLTGRGVR